MDALLATPGLAWLILAAVLAITELLMPGIFLVFVAAGAALTGVVTLIIPEFAVLFQVAVFIIATSTAVAIGRRWYAQNPVASAATPMKTRKNPGAMISAISSKMPPIIHSQPGSRLSIISLQSSARRARKAARRDLT